MTIARVAEAASVSYATAWRALNNDPAVSDEVAQRVRAAMDHVGYVPSRRRARRPKPADSSRTGNIALLLLRTGATVAPRVLHEIERLLREQDLNLIFSVLEPGKPLPVAVRSGNVDGILGYGEFPDDAITDELKAVPAVWMMTRADLLQDPWGDRVHTDSRAIGSIAAKYLLDQGHRELCYFRIEHTTRYEQERLRAFVATAETAGATVQIFRTPDEDRASARDRVSRLVDRWMAAAPRATGAFIPTDRETEVVYWQLERRGVTIGRDLQVVSCDNDEDILQRLHPRPVSIDLNREALAQVAVDRLTWRMDNGMKAPPLVIQVAPSLPGAGARSFALTD